jgi:hypothetical protein
MYPSSLAQVRAMIKKKYPKLNLARGHGEGYYYFFSDDEELDLKLSSLNSTSVYVYSVKQLSLDKWMEEADSIMKQVSLKESRVHSNKVMTEDKWGWPVEERNLVEAAQQMIEFDISCPGEDTQSMQETVMVTFEGGGHDPEILKELAVEMEKVLNKVMCESKGRISHKVR